MLAAIINNPGRTLFLSVICCIAAVAMVLDWIGEMIEPLLDRWSDRSHLNDPDSPDFLPGAYSDKEVK